jgi:hypothetical protein
MFDMTDAELVADLAKRGQLEDYTDAQVKGDAGVVAITRLMYTHAILAGICGWGYEDRWCYSSYAKARAALDAWTGAEGTEPAGWHRHPSSGRRVDENGRAYVER